MNKHLWMALSAMALVSACSNDEMIDVNNGEAIDFSVTTRNVTRAATTTKDIKEFKVWAYMDNEAYMDGLKVTKNEFATTWSYEGGQKFWPDEELDFFAVSPANTATTCSKAGGTISNYTVDGKTDLLYAATLDQSKPTNGNTPVKINFRHALSMLVIEACNQNSNLKVNIDGIRVVNAKNKGTFTWSASTGKQYSAESPSYSAPSEGVGSWTEVSKTESSNFVVENANKIDDLTDQPQYITPGDKGSEALFMLPQELGAWNGTKDNEGIHFLLNCQLIDKSSNKQLWPKEVGEYAEVGIPLIVPNADKRNWIYQWEAGVKYIYTISFRNGAGFNPNPEDETEPEPILLPINIDVTADEYVITSNSTSGQGVTNVENL